MRQNGYWIGNLHTAHLLGRDPAEMLQRPHRIAEVTPEILRDVFRRYFRGSGTPSLLSCPEPERHSDVAYWGSPDQLLDEGAVFLKVRRH